MKVKIILLLIVVFLLTVFSQTEKKDRIIVKFDSQLTGEQIEKFTDKFELKKVDEIKKLNIVTFQLIGRHTSDQIIEEIKSQNNVVYVERDYSYETGEMKMVKTTNQQTESENDTMDQVVPFNQLTEIDTIPGEILLKYKDIRAEEREVPLAQQIGIQAIESIPELGIQRYRIVTGKTMKTVLNELKQEPNIEFAEPNYVVYALETPNDPNFDRLWGLHNEGQTGGTFDADIDAPEAWEKEKGKKDVIVSIIDTGIDYTHPDLVSNIWVNNGEVPNNGNDDDNNGFVDDFRGWDFAYDDADPMDDNRHGTHCAGTVGAVGNNNEGVVGVNWTVSLMPVKFLNSDGSGTTSDAVKAIIYSVDNGAHVLSNSWGGGGESESLKDAIEYANDKGALFIAAAGNASTDNNKDPHYPSNYDIENVVAVAASNDDDNLAGFSNYGKTTVDLAAPGVNIYSSVPGGRYESLSGTSMATPHVSGAAALVWAHFLPQSNKDLVKYRLFGAVNYVRDLQDEVLLDGRLNVNTALSDQPLIAVIGKLFDTDDETGPYQVKASVIDDAVVNSVKLFYRITENSSGSDTLDMTAEGNFVYAANIPGANSGSKVEYKVSARDSDGNLAETRFYSFRVGETNGGCCGSFAATVESDTPVKGELATFLLNFLLFFGPPVFYRWYLKNFKNRQ